MRTRAACQPQNSDHLQSLKGLEALIPFAPADIINAELDLIAESGLGWGDFEHNCGKEEGDKNESEENNGAEEENDEAANGDAAWILLSRQGLRL